MSASDTTTFVRPARHCFKPTEGFLNEVQPYAVLGAAGIVLVGAKAGAAELGVSSWFRQLVLVAVLGVTTYAATGRPTLTKFLRLVGLLPIRPTGRIQRSSWLRRGMVAVAVVAAVASAASQSDTTRLQLALVVAGFGLLLVAIEIVRHGRWRWPRRHDAVALPARETNGEAKRPPKLTTVVRIRPRRLVLWAVVSVVLAGAGTSATLSVDGRTTEMTMSELGELLAVTAFGEELLFRGLLLVLAYRLVGRMRGEIATAIAFGLWHVPDAIVDGGGSGLGIQIGVVAGQLVITTAAGFLFSWMRHRTESLLGPTALHVAANLPGTALIS